MPERQVHPSLSRQCAPATAPLALLLAEMEALALLLPCHRTRVLGEAETEAAFVNLPV